jgi:predicted membrane protein
VKNRASVTRVDWVIVVFAAVTAAAGFRRGLVGTVLALAGLVLGAIIGARIAPDLLSSGAKPKYPALVGLGGAVTGAALFHALAGILSGTLRMGLRLAPPLRLVDSFGGLVAGAVWGLALAWVVGAVAVQLPGHPSWRREARQSHVLHRLNQIAPPKDVLKLKASLLERFSPPA